MIYEFKWPRKPKSAGRIVRVATSDCKVIDADLPLRSFVGQHYLTLVNWCKLKGIKHKLVSINCTLGARREQ
jgi:hypothetical protein